MSDKLSDALAKFDAMMAHLGGCTDGGCVIKRPAGMHTNGGCRCPQDKMKMQRAMRAANDLREAVSAFLAASHSPATHTTATASYAVRVCELSDSQCSRGCGNGPCKKERGAA
ncbi:hypothetical protein [Burkholderia glumae]|uniref:hypothetical protein n=1 Tax=Burkholderia glumae TaxID=337 RepID=UPI003B9A448D